MNSRDKTLILVVGESRRGVEVVPSVLRVAGYEVVTATRDEDALYTARLRLPDLILIDVAVLGLNGYLVCAQLKADAQTRHIPVALMMPRRELLKLEMEGIGADELLVRPITRVELLARVRSLLRARRQLGDMVGVEDTLLVLAAAIEAKDPYTEGHVGRVGSYASLLSEEIGLSAADRQRLRQAGMVHDVGKVAVREDVLLKPGPLTAAEMEHVRIHPIVGEEICRPLARWPIIFEAVRSHHERYDGKGYPDGLVGQFIPLAARIVAVADVFDVLTSDRPYRRRLSREQALAVLRRESGRHFDPAVALPFISLAESGRLHDLSTT